MILAVSPSRIANFKATLDPVQLVAEPIHLRLEMCNGFRVLHLVATQPEDGGVSVALPDLNLPQIAYDRVQFPVKAAQIVERMIFGLVRHFDLSCPTACDFTTPRCSRAAEHPP
jgi:hypothetical protein